jgi:Tfp pilus assembly protein PilE
MNKISKNENGFTFVEALLIILILAVIGGVGYMVYHNNHKSKTASVSTTAAKTSTATTSKATTSTSSTLKTYSSDYAGVSFQYPSTWSLKAQTDAGASSSSAQEAVLTSPNGFVLTYYDYIAPRGGTCPNGSQDVTLTSVQQITTANSPHGLYLVESGSNIGLDMQEPAPSTGDQGTCIFNPTITDGTFNTKTQPAFTTNIDFPAGTPQTIPADQTQDFAAAETILKSFKYSN